MRVQQAQKKQALRMQSLFSFLTVFDHWGAEASLLTSLYYEYIN